MSDDIKMKHEKIATPDGRSRAEARREGCLNILSAMLQKDREVAILAMLYALEHEGVIRYIRAERASITEWLEGGEADREDYLRTIRSELGVAIGRQIMSFGDGMSKECVVDRDDGTGLTMVTATVAVVDRNGMGKWRRGS